MRPSPIPPLQECLYRGYRLQERIPMTSVRCLLGTDTRQCRMAAFTGPAQNYLNSDVLVHNDHRAAPDLMMKSRPRILSIPVHGELLHIAIKIALGTLSVHNLGVAASFWGTWPLLVQDRCIEAGRCFKVAG